jgi:uncharacterized protein (TIGR00251 family)
VKSTIKKGTVPYVRLSVRVTPRSGRDEVEVLADGSLKVRLTTPPVDDKANEALVELLAKHLAVPKSAIRIVRGRTGRNKVVEIRKG